MANFTRLYKDSGEEWKGSLRSLARECSSFNEKSWEILDTKYVTDPETGAQVASYKLGSLVREISYVSRREEGMKEPYISITCVRENGKQTYPKMEESKE